MAAHAGARPQRAPGRRGSDHGAPGRRGQDRAALRHHLGALRAKIRANAQDTYYHFEYGRTTSLGAETESQYAGNGWQAAELAAEVGGLAPGSTYYFRVVATNDAGVTAGGIREFKTKSLEIGATGHKRRPEFAKLLVAEAHEGSIRCRPPGSRRWRELAGSGAELPMGAIVDARRGSIALTSVSRAGTLQTGRFGGGIFSVHQPPQARGRVDLRLRGGDFSRCRRTARRSTTAGASALRRIRRLWGRDRGGRFRTYGRHSHATVRGTRWLTEDRCRGTHTRVSEGAVVVRDVARGPTVVVRAGRSYLARRPRR